MDEQRQLDQLQRDKLVEQTHQHNLAQIEVQRTIDERLQGEARINALQVTGSI